MIVETVKINDNPALAHYSCADTQCGSCNIGCEHDIEIYADDLRCANVGKRWAIEDCDRCPNARAKWDVSYTVVYKDERGVSVLFRDENPDIPVVKLIWVELGTDD